MNYSVDEGAISDMIMRQFWHLWFLSDRCNMFTQPNTEYVKARLGERERYVLKYTKDWIFLCLRRLQEVLSNAEQGRSVRFDEAVEHFGQVAEQLAAEGKVKRLPITVDKLLKVLGEMG